MDSTMLPLDTSCQATYADGFVLSETDRGDKSLYVEGKNTFFDIYERLPEREHGPMVTFSVYWENARYDIDWRFLPDSARPIRFRHGYAQLAVGGGIETGFSGVDFGVQWNDENGRNQQDVTRLGKKLSSS